FTRNHFVAL
ncbi:hypothetical protein D043_3114B, partial [Vibrio parahaemolyticus EKP-021]